MSFKGKISFQMVFLTLSIFSCDNENKDSEPKENPTIRSTVRTGENWRLHTTYELNNHGNQQIIQWRRETPVITEGKDVYAYNEDNRVVSLTRSIGGLVDEEIEYVWKDNQIIASKSYINDQPYAYTFYEYNEKAQLIALEYMERDASGIGYLRQNESEFTYTEDGNLFQVFDYRFNVESLMVELVAVKTYVGYTGKVNPVPDVEILPTIKMQTGLPLGYSIATKDGISQYKIEYTLRADKYPAERKETLEGGGSVVYTIYTYK